MTEEIQLSDAEKRMLRRVFHRHALPYIAALGLVALIALSGGSEEAAESGTDGMPGVALAPPVDVEALLETQNRADQLLSELATASEKRVAELQGRIVALEKRVAGLDTANRQIAALEKRLGTTTRRLEKMEASSREALEVTARTSKPAPSKDANPYSIQDKLRRLSAKEEQLQAETVGVPAAPANTTP